MTAGSAPEVAAPGAGDSRTRARVKAYLLAHGGATAGEVGEALGLGPAAIRKHLDAMLIEGDVSAREQHVLGARGRGRPAKTFALTDAGRLRFGGHTYDDLANAALRWIARDGGEAAVAAFAAASRSTAGTQAARRACGRVASHSTDASPIAVSDASWLRWRRLARASPALAA